MIRRLFGPDSLKLRLRLFAAELIGTAGFIASLYVAGKVTRL